MINSLLDFLADKYPLFCKGCGAKHNVVNEDGKTKTLHPGLTSSKDTSPLPTPDCVVSIDYVSFYSCGHCCPETYATCPDCALQEQGWIPGHGRVTDKQCSCHLVEGSEASAKNAQPEAGDVVDYINKGRGIYVRKIEVINVGDITNSTGIAIGPGAATEVTNTQAPQSNSNPNP